MIRLLILGDAGLFREGLVSLLSRHLEVESVWEASDIESALRTLADERPQIVLVDGDMMGRSAFDGVRALKARYPDCPIVLMSCQDGDVFVQAALEAGIDAQVLKSDGMSGLLDAIESVRQGEPFFSPSVASRLSAENGRIRLARPRCKAIAELTETERELLRILGTGATLKKAAASLGLSYKTADNRKTGLMRKLGVHDRVELAHFAIREGLILPQ
jgi:DNA-binding NarL/FixJ family response regulator